MSKAMFGIVAGLALTMSPAWAGDEKSQKKSTSETVAGVESRKVSQSDAAAGSVVAVASDRRELRQANDVRTSHEKRWMLEREGYRDGGY